MKYIFIFVFVLFGINVSSAQTLIEGGYAIYAELTVETGKKEGSYALWFNNATFSNNTKELKTTNNNIPSLLITLQIRQIHCTVFDDPSSCNEQNLSPVTERVQLVETGDIKKEVEVGGFIKQELVMNRDTKVTLSYYCIKTDVVKPLPSK